MIQRTLQRVATAGALAVVLFMAAAVPAQARDLAPASRAWQWFQDLWTKGAIAVWIRAGADDPRTESSADLRKTGSGVDPDSTSGQSPTSTPPCETCGEQGPGQDPNG